MHIITAQIRQLHLEKAILRYPRCLMFKSIEKVIGDNCTNETSAFEIAISRYPRCL